ncbi:MAG: PaaI family thioesterase [Terricaulis sp.]
MTADELTAFFGEVFEGYDAAARPVTFADGKRAVVRQRYEVAQLRPGGTVSGPTMMGLADMAMYALVLSAIGKVPLAVTTNLSINFLRKPPPADLIAEARMLKLGKALAVGDVIITSDGSDDPVAHAVVTYSIPPQRVTTG